MKSFEKVPNKNEQIRPWMVSPDGDAYCSDCWHEYILKLDREDRKIAQEDSAPLGDVIEKRGGVDKEFCYDCSRPYKE